MSDDQRIKSNIEKTNVSPEQERSRDHFLEENYETLTSPDRQRKYERREKNIEQHNDLITENVGEGSNIVSQGIYNQQQEERKQEIEKVLEKDLGDIYVSLTPEKRKQFRIMGEQTAAAINDLFNTGKLKLKKIIELIRKWLSIIPGVNRFFLEQEAKIKADEIIKLGR